MGFISKWRIHGFSFAKWLLDNIDFYSEMVLEKTWVFIAEWGLEKQGVLIAKLDLEK